MWNALPNVGCPIFLFYGKEKVYHRMSFRSSTYKRLYQGWKDFVDSTGQQEGDTICFRVIPFNDGFGLQFYKKSIVIIID
ncbi:hypothetical protein RND71_001447 [Anisodus tanguticus]|uniref:TF-B3 domain-containing protein n=1 Tax=Anisodus tanguticus TaxID=243964 RepID=A0AAE1VYH3_9SOLA|nr:hypothetical protein RND71_001447 [Anisodus tanguticus]